MNIWHDINENRISKTEFVGVVEITKGGKNKYELDKETGMLKLDRVLYTSTHYPTNYGFIPRTYAEDKDPLDVLILCEENIIPLSLVECYPIGVLIMNDGGEEDEKMDKDYRNNSRRVYRRGIDLFCIGRFCGCKERCFYFKTRY